MPAAREGRIDPMVFSKCCQTEKKTPKYHSTCMQQTLFANIHKIASNTYQILESYYWINTNLSPFTRPNFGGLSLRNLAQAVNGMIM